MATRRGVRVSQEATSLIAALGGVLAVAHVWQGYQHAGSILAIEPDVAIPLVFALALVYGGYWAKQRDYRQRYQRYLLLWTVVGGLGVTGLGGVVVIELALHEPGPSSPLSVLTTAATAGTVIGLMIGIYGVRGKRKTDLVTSLQDAATALMEAESQQAVADETVTIAHDVLDVAIAGVWLADEERSELRPVAATARSNSEFPDHPSYEKGNSLSWRAFETGESIVAHDLQEHSDRHNPDTILRSEVVLPLGKQGVLNIGATEPNAFDETDVSVAHILSTSQSIAS